MRNDFLYFAPVKEKGVRQGTKGCLKTFLVGECATREWGVWLFDLRLKSQKIHVKVDDEEPQA